MEKPLTSVRRESMDLAGLLEEHGDHLLRLCTLYLGDRSQAEDAVQDTFLRALRAWPGFRGDCAVFRGCGAGFPSAFSPVMK